MSERWTVRAGLAGLVAITASVTLYALLRAAQSFTHPDPDPALVLWSEHAGYFWRAWTAAYAGGMVGFAAYAARLDSGRLASGLARAVVVAALVLAAQGLALP